MNKNGVPGNQWNISVADHTRSYITPRIQDAQSNPQNEDTNDPKCAIISTKHTRYAQTEKRNPSSASRSRDGERQLRGFS